MRVVVQLFGPQVQQAGRSRLEVTVDRPTVEGVLAAVRKAAPDVVLDRGVRVAINSDYADPSGSVREGDVVSLIPPVGGG